MTKHPEHHFLLRMFCHFNTFRSGIFRNGLKGHRSGADETRRLGLGYRFAHIPYKWNTMLGVFMAELDGSIVLISLPAIFYGIGINPLALAETDYLLWTLMGYKESSRR